MMRPNTDAAAINRMADKVAADANAAGTSLTRIPGTQSFGDHLLVASPWGEEDEPGTDRLIPGAAGDPVAAAV